MLPEKDVRKFYLIVFTASSRSFKFVSPSRFMVDTKTISFGALISNKSAGTSSFFCT